MKADATTQHGRLYVLIQYDPAEICFKWNWWVLDHRLDRGYTPGYRETGVLAHSFASTRWGARWSARRACRWLSKGWNEKTERWTYDPRVADGASDG